MIEGFSYGALSGTFHQYRDDIIEIMKDQNKILSGNDGKYSEKHQASPKQSTQNI